MVRLLSYRKGFVMIMTRELNRFLLHYTSRDSVDVLATGSKGINEMREEAESYYRGADESLGTKGPLFGMIYFRRRKVLVKLVLEGTSRLVQGTYQWA